MLEGQSVDWNRQTGDLQGFSSFEELDGVTGGSWGMGEGSGELPNSGERHLSVAMSVVSEVSGVSLGVMRSGEVACSLDDMQISMSSQSLGEVD